MRRYTYIYIYTHICVNIYIYIYIHTYTYIIYIYIYAHTPRYFEAVGYMISAAPPEQKDRARLRGQGCENAANIQ